MNKKHQLLRTINEFLRLIPYDSSLDKRIKGKYARAYYQGRFDVLMELKVRLQEEIKC